MSSGRRLMVMEDSVDRSALEVREVLAREALEPPTPTLLTSSTLHSRE